MLAHFLHRITTKIRRFGYAMKHAVFLARALVVWMVDVALLFGMVRVVQETVYNPITGCKSRHSGKITAAHCYAPYGIQR